jgi:hypothetical protein
VAEPESRAWRGVVVLLTAWVAGCANPRPLPASAPEKPLIAVAAVPGAPPATAASPASGPVAREDRVSVLRMVPGRAFLDGADAGEVPNRPAGVARELGKHLQRKRRESGATYLRLELDAGLSGNEAHTAASMATLEGWSSLRLEIPGGNIVLHGYLPPRGGPGVGNVQPLPLPQDVLTIDVLRDRIEFWRTRTADPILAVRLVRVVPHTEYARALLAECAERGECNPLVVRHTYTEQPFATTVTALTALSHSLGATSSSPLEVLTTVWEPNDAHFAPTYERPRVRIAPLGELHGAAAVHAPLETFLSGEPSYFRDCYAEALARNSKLEGLGVIELETDQSGAAARGRIEPVKFDDVRLTECLSQEIKRLRLPSFPDAQVKLHVHFFAPREPSK